MNDSDAKDERGRYVKGLAPGRPPGTKNKHPRAERRQVRDNLETIQASAQNHLPEVLEFLAQEAKSNHAAAANYIRLTSPVVAKQYIEGAEIVADLPLEDRLPALTALMARGAVDLASGQALAGIVKAEIEYRYVRPLKAAVRDLEQALKTGDRKGAEDALYKLARELNTASPAIDAEVVE